MLKASLELLEGKANRLLWVPSIALGYMFTITASPIDFALSAYLILGARVLNDIMERIDEEEIETQQLPVAVPNLVRENFRWGGIGLSVVVLPYLVGVVRGWYLLYIHFEHTDLIIVAISIGYVGTALIALANALLSTS